ncbi:hypothetical protein BDZ85DRAFT_2182 [Elsinoe ampelina]|uniref:Uncharacterized protein n=1 Tax=Elsinoe ampelina TaxID=302913 RepID=A0A6A6GNJ6_9PEZI|nr:hypothetical protein BDZ85DRAFT_2182 [Elsinoe ampelina]
MSKKSPSARPSPNPNPPAAMNQITLPPDPSDRSFPIARPTRLPPTAGPILTVRYGKHLHDILPVPLHPCRRKPAPSPRGSIFCPGPHAEQTCLLYRTQRAVAPVLHPTGQKIQRPHRRRRPEWHHSISLGASGIDRSGDSRLRLLHLISRFSPLVLSLPIYREPYLRSHVSSVIPAPSSAPRLPCRAV